MNEQIIKEISNTSNIKISSIQNVLKLLEEGCIFTRENDEFRFKLDTIKKEATYLLKETNTLLDIIVEKCEYFVYPDKTEITYKLESDDCLNSIELTKGDN